MTKASALQADLPRFYLPDSRAPNEHIVRWTGYSGDRADAAIGEWAYHLPIDVSRRRDDYSELGINAIMPTTGLCRVIQ